MNKTRANVAPALKAQWTEGNATTAEVRTVHTHARTARTHRILGARGKRIHTWQLRDGTVHMG